MGPFGAGTGMYLKIICLVIFIHDHGESLGDRRAITNENYAMWDFSFSH